MEQAGAPILGLPGHRKALTPERVDELSETLKKLILALERLLYAPA
jgi:hypothetical protein